MSLESPTDPLDRLRSAMQRVLAQRSSLVDALRTVAGSLHGRGRQRATQLAEQLEMLDAPELARQTPSMVRLLLPLIAAAAKEGGGVSETQIADAVANWQTVEANRRAEWLPLPLGCLYPLVMLFASLLVLTAICLTIVPEFAGMFKDFGLSLPAPTQFLVSLSGFLTTWGGWLLLSLIVMVLGGAIVRARRRSAVRSSGVDPVSSRETLADWAEQLGWLSHAGLTATQSVTVASRFSSATWLREFSQHLAAMGIESESESPLSAPPSGRDSMAHVRVVMDQRIDLLAQAIAVPAAELRGEVLREVALIYRLTDQASAAWWSVWGAQAASIAIGIVVMMVVLALYLPLVSLISGLS